MTSGDQKHLLQFCGWVKSYLCWFFLFFYFFKSKRILSNYKYNKSDSCVNSANCLKLLYHEGHNHKANQNFDLFPFFLQNKNILTFPICNICNQPLSRQVCNAGSPSFKQMRVGWNCNLLTQWVWVKMWTKCSILYFLIKCITIFLDV